MDKATVVELVTWKSVDGVAPDTAKELMQRLNNFVGQQPGFISRTTAYSPSGKFCDVVYWTDLASAQAASKKAESTPELGEVFATVDQTQMMFDHFEIFNQFEK